jgi:hypothetical protein
MVHGVDHPGLKYIFTTEKRAHAVQDLVYQMPRFIKKDDYVLVYENIPMVYYLTGSRPYLDNSWPDLYNPQQFSEKLNQSLKEKSELPVIIRARFNSRSFNWPDNLKTVDDESYRERRDIMENFIGTHNYTPVWNDDFFEILTPD